MLHQLNLRMRLVLAPTQHRAVLFVVRDTSKVVLGNILDSSMLVSNILDNRFQHNNSHLLQHLVVAVTRVAIKADTLGDQWAGGHQWVHHPVRHPIHPLTETQVRVSRRPCTTTPACRTTRGPRMPSTRTPQLSHIRSSTVPVPGRTSDPFILIHKFRWDGAMPPCDGMMDNGI